MVNPDHLEILKQGVEAWNKWRLDNAGGISIDLSGLTLISMELDGANFRKVDLSRSRLDRARLREVDCTESRLDYVNFSRAHLSRAKLCDVSLSNANLQDADLRGVDLTGADLTDADLSRANLKGANLGGRVHYVPDYDPPQLLAFVDEYFIAEVTRVCLKRANLNNVILSGVNLSYADFSGAKLHNADLTGADLTGADLSTSSLHSADLRGANLTDAKLVGADLTGADLAGADFTNILLSSTSFGDNDLSQVRGLENAIHAGPSTISIATIYRSQGNIPEAFLRGCGLPEDFITYARSFATKAIEFYSCFISYSSKDQEFADRLYLNLQDKGVRCWFAPEDLKIGDRFRDRIDESIRLYDKLLLILSENSVSSPWVSDEVEAAIEREHREGRTVLFPIKINEAVIESKQAWAAAIRRTRHIGDFTRWKDHDSYRKAFDRLLRDLKAEGQPQ